MDCSGQQTFTKTEAEAYVGRTVKTTGGTSTIARTFCEGPDAYSLIDDKGNLIYKCHNHCAYVMEATPQEKE